MCVAAADSTGTRFRWEHCRKTVYEEEPVVTGQLSLENALKPSLANNKALQAVMQEREVARGRVLSSHSGLLPAVSPLGLYARYAEPLGLLCLSVRIKNDADLSNLQASIAG